MAIDFEITDLAEMDENKIFAVRVALGNMPRQRQAQHMQAVKDSLKPITEKVQAMGGYVIYVPVSDQQNLDLNIFEKTAFDEIAELVKNVDNFENAKGVLE